jgi:ribosome-binding protein aMBF1 (putative translation factor)
MTKKCTICKSENVELFEGVYEGEMVLVCDYCAEEEGIPVLKRPSVAQLDKIEEKESMRERMERLSGMRKHTRSLGPDQTVAQHNLAKLKNPYIKQTHPDVHNNYYWEINMARRRRKITLSQVSRATEIPEEILKDVEHGIIPKNMEEVFLKLEQYFGIKLLKNHEKIVNFTKTQASQDKIIQEVRNRMKHTDTPQTPEKVTQRIQAGELDFSKKEDIKDVTLNDLIDQKKKREYLEKEKKLREETISMMGEDIELDDLD